MIVAKDRGGKWHVLKEDGICHRCASGFPAFVGHAKSNMAGHMCLNCRKNPNKDTDIMSIEIAEITETEWEAWQLVENL